MDGLKLIFNDHFMIYCIINLHNQDMNDAYVIILSNIECQTVLCAQSYQ